MHTSLREGTTLCSDTVPPIGVDASIHILVPIDRQSRDGTGYIAIGLKNSEGSSDVSDRAREAEVIAGSVYNALEAENGHSAPAPVDRTANKIAVLCAGVVALGRTPVRGRTCPGDRIGHVGAHVALARSSDGGQVDIRPESRQEGVDSGQGIAHTRARAMPHLYGVVFAFAGVVHKRDCGVIAG